MTDGASLDELRDLSRRSRRTQRWGFLTILGTLVLVPAASFFAGTPHLSWALALTLVAGGLLFTRFAFVAGQERGAYRRVFKRINDERKAARRLVVQEGPAEPLAKLR